MKNTTFIKATILIAGLTLITGFTYAGFGQNSLSGNNMGNGQRFTNSNSGVTNSNYATYGVNITRTVTNITSGVEVTMTTTDADTLAHMKTMYSENASKTPKNTLITTTRTELENGIKLTITSTDAETVKLIQQRANSAKSGAFGNGGTTKGQMMGKGLGKGNGQGKGRGNAGAGRGECPMMDNDAK